jgi:hypothetical protein
MLDCISNRPGLQRLHQLFHIGQIDDPPAKIQALRVPGKNLSLPLGVEGIDTGGYR